MKKKALTYISIIALIAALCLSLVACNTDLYAKNIKETLKKTGYDVELFESDDEEVDVVEERFKESDDYSGRIRWIIVGTKASEGWLLDGDLIQIYKFALTSDAKQFEEDSKDENLTENWTVLRKGNIVMCGSAEAIALFD